MDDTLGQFGAMIAKELGAAVTGYQVAHGELTIRANADAIVKIASFLRDDERCQFWSFIDVTAIGVSMWFTTCFRPGSIAASGSRSKPTRPRQYPRSSRSIRARIGSSEKP